MSERTLRLASAVLAAAGAAITGYLLYVRQTGGTLVCSIGGCETVQSSSYADVLGVPVAGLGLLGFLGLLAAALARGEWARMTQATLALSAFFFSAYLLYIQVGVIEAVCQWCLATDVITTAIAVLAPCAFAAARRPRLRPCHERARIRSAGRPAARSRSSEREHVDVPPGHDAWVVGNESCVALDLG